MKKTTKEEWIAVVLMLIVIDVMCLWCVDISVSAMLTSPNLILTNGWQTREPMLMYHMGLYGCLIITTALSLIGIHFIYGAKNDDSNN